MNITLKWLEEQEACAEGRAWYSSQHEENLNILIHRLIKEERFDWANWVITKAMTHKQNVLYACYSAQLSLHLFEKQYPKDDRPRKAIQAAMKWARNPSEIHGFAARSAAGAAGSAARFAARSPARSAAWSAGSAAWFAAESAGFAAGAAGSAARFAAGSAGSAAWSAAGSAGFAAAWKKIIYYGLKLLK